MTMLRQQEKELKRTEGKLTRQLNRLNRQRTDSAYLSLPTIALSDVRQSPRLLLKIELNTMGTVHEHVISVFTGLLQRPVV